METLDKLICIQKHMKKETERPRIYNDPLSPAVLFTVVTEILEILIEKERKA